MAVTRDGIPVRCWAFPGNTSDQEIIRRIKDDLDGWNLRRLIWVADRGFASAANRAYLTRGGGHYIHAEKLRHANSQAAAALARQGRYHTVAGNLRVKEVWVPRKDERGTGRAVRHLPQPRSRRAGPAVRERLSAHLEGLIEGSDAWTPAGATSSSAPCAGSPGCAGSCAAPRQGCCGSTRPRSAGRPAWTASGCCAPTTRPSHQRTWPPRTSSSLPSSAGGRT